MSLDTLIAERLAAPFVWGANDCALFAADAVKAQTGTDPAESLRGTYSTQVGAARVIKRDGGLQNIAAKALGEPLAGPLLAQAGDVGIVEQNGADVLAVCHAGGWIAPGPQGLCAMPIRAARVAWRVAK